MDVVTLLDYVRQGGDVAVFAVLYYTMKTSNKLDAVEIHQGYLKNRVTRLETKVEEVKHGMVKTQEA